MLNSARNFLAYWYMRYLLVTELFMVAKWERHMFHVIALILLTILGLFNKLIVVGGVRFLRQLYVSYTYQPVMDQLQSGSAEL